MFSRRRRKVELGIEALERRETPSASGTTAAFGHVAPHATTAVQFKGAGHAAINKELALSNGGLFTQAVILGSASDLGPNGRPGNFFGVDYTIFTKGFQSYHSVAVIQAPDGSRLVLNILGTATATSTGSKGTFTVLGGTGRFLHATGQGTVTGSLTMKPPSLSFNFNGVLRP